MKRESMRLGNLLLEDWGALGCKLSLLNPADPDESLAERLSHEQSALLAKWLVGAEVRADGVPVLDARPGDFAERLLCACQVRGTRVRLAKALRTGPMIVSHWTRGNNLPDNAHCRGIAEFFGWDVDETTLRVNAERVARSGQLKAG